MTGLGTFGEAWAAGHLSRLGYRIVDRNVRYRTGEIDLVAWDGPELVFIEVKCRRSGAFGTPAEAVTRPKYKRLSSAVQTYLAERSIEPDAYRIDLVSIEVGLDGRVRRHELLKNVEPPV